MHDIANELDIIYRTQTKEWNFEGEKEVNITMILCGHTGLLFLSGVIVKPQKPQNCTYQQDLLPRWGYERQGNERADGTGPPKSTQRGHICIPISRVTPYPLPPRRPQERWALIPQTFAEDNLERIKAIPQGCVVDMAEDCFPLFGDLVREYVWNEPGL
ncbi:hypothetical protein TNCV_3581421 [Trichonephila clavipes]|nr:hypothetical protein TNCV_3581421 [Trichonephila clavipes]